ncbi:hypothetical protein HYH03_003060 [Edaphochlamys debaryana]|uniref:RING-CH-type domain-containing protein n=1 Tax=Edaphochlamys debaryana TaxID=47281 RepID=A0A836C4G0_9CHLO|nr:hypothetical protein HYH03_003060 [Edaphochlamys debaryana]|eukprot:KAG2498868.1 hypothetical protein HYH03_003060 [Edaphochlamys debaryana]
MAPPPLTIRYITAEDDPPGVDDSVVAQAVEVYRAHVASQLLPILGSALRTPSSLWIRGSLLPLFFFYLTYRPASLTPYIVAVCVTPLVVIVVAVFIRVQLTILQRKATESDLSVSKLPGYFSDQGWGKDSRFFVALEPSPGAAKEGGDGGAGGKAAAARGRVLGCVGVRNRSGGQAELMYFCTRPGLDDVAEVADALLDSAVTHARKAGFADVIIKINSAETALLDAARRADLDSSSEQLIPINAWFRAYRLQCSLKKGRRASALATGRSMHVRAPLEPFPRRLRQQAGAEAGRAPRPDRPAAELAKAGDDGPGTPDQCLSGSDDPGAGGRLDSLAGAAGLERTAAQEPGPAHSSASFGAPPLQQRSHAAAAAAGPGAGSCMGTAGGAEEVEDGEEVCCRVCLDPVTPSELASGAAIMLGCRCGSGLDRLHRPCAERWFRGVRCSTTCEVCGEEAAALPQRIKAEIRWQQLLYPRRGPGISGLLAGLPGFLGLYTLVCLLPATFASMALVIFYFRFMGLDAGATMALSILTASATILHWVLNPYRPVLHLVFCAVSLGSVFAQTLLFHSLCPAWAPALVASLGSVLGFLAGSALFYGVLNPLAALLRLGLAELMATRRAAVVGRGGGQRGVGGMGAGGAATGVGWVGMRRWLRWWGGPAGGVAAMGATGPGQETVMVSGEHTGTWV